jgi:hypothetical protein
VDVSRRIAAKRVRVTDHRSEVAFLNSTIITPGHDAFHVDPRIFRPIEPAKR